MMHWRKIINILIDCFLVNAQAHKPISIWSILWVWIFSTACHQLLVSFKIDMSFQWTAQFNLVFKRSLHFHKNCHLLAFYTFLIKCILIMAELIIYSVIKSNSILKLWCFFYAYVCSLKCSFIENLQTISEMRQIPLKFHRNKNQRKSVRIWFMYVNSMNLFLANETKINKPTDVLEKCSISFAAYENKIVETN